MSDWHDPCYDRRHSSAGGTAGRVTSLPRRGRIAIKSALRRAGHRVLGRCGTAENIDARRPQKLAIIRVRLNDHAFTKTTAEVDLSPSLMSKDVFHEERDAAKWTVAQSLFVQAVDPITISFNDRVDRRIDCFYRPGSRLGQFPRRDLFPRHQFRQPERVIPCVFVDIHVERY